MQSFLLENILQKEDCLVARAYWQKKVTTEVFKGLLSKAIEYSSSK